MSRILLTGGTGLISTPMTLDLRERGHNITIFDRGKRAPDLPDTTGEDEQIDKPDPPSWQRSRLSVASVLWGEVSLLLYGPQRCLTKPTLRPRGTQN